MGRGSSQDARTWVGWNWIPPQVWDGEKSRDYFDSWFFSGVLKACQSDCLLASLIPFESRICFWQQDNSGQGWLSWELYLNMRIQIRGISAQCFWLWTFCLVVCSKKVRLSQVCFVQAFRVFWTTQLFFHPFKRRYDWCAKGRGELIVAWQDWLFGLGVLQITFPVGNLIHNWITINSS